MGFFTVIIIIILCLFFYLFFVQGLKKDLHIKHKTDGNNKSEKNSSIDNTPSFPLQNSPQNLPDDQGVILSEQYQPVRTDGLKKQIQAGIDLVFSQEQDSVSTIGTEDVSHAVRQRVLNQIESFSPFKTVHQINKTLDDLNTNMSKLSKLIVTDTVLSGRILKAANSACFGLQQEVNSIGHALIIIGLLNPKTILYQERILR